MKFRRELLGMQGVRQRGIRMDFEETVEQALDALGVPPSDDWEVIEETARRKLGEERIEEFEFADPEERLALVLADFPAAMTFAIGFRRAEFHTAVPWFMKQVHHLDADPDSVIVDIGAGAGFTAALMSVASNRKVIATEVIDTALPVIEEVGRHVGARVEALAAGIEDFVSITAKYSVETAILQRVLPYLDLPHEHCPGYSWVVAIENQYAVPELRNTVVDEFFQACTEVKQILILDWMCVERWAALIALAAESGFELDRAQSTRLLIHSSDGTSALHAMRFVRVDTPQLVDAVQLMDLQSGFSWPPGPRWQHSDFDLYGWDAERVAMEFESDGEWYRVDMRHATHGRTVIGLFERVDGAWSYSTGDKGDRVLRYEGPSMEVARNSLKAKYVGLEPLQT
jgi:SAM-dependent methyltransferase